MSRRPRTAELAASLPLTTITPDGLAILDNGTLIRAVRLEAALTPLRMSSTEMERTNRAVQEIPALLPDRQALQLITTARPFDWTTEVDRIQATTAQLERGAGRRRSRRACRRALPACRRRRRGARRAGRAALRDGPRAPTDHAVEATALGRVQAPAPRRLLRRDGRGSRRSLPADRHPPRHARPRSQAARRRAVRHEPVPGAEPDEPSAGGPGVAAARPRLRLR